MRRSSRRSAVPAPTSSRTTAPTAPAPKRPPRRSRTTGSCSSAPTSSTRQRPRVSGRAATAWRPIDVLVNNAAVMEQVPFDAPLEEWHHGWERAYRINILATADLTRAAVPHFVERGGGVIVTMSSWVAQRGPGSTVIRRVRGLEGRRQGAHPDGRAPLRLPWGSRLRARAGRRADAALRAGRGALRRRGGRALDPRDGRDGAAVRHRRARASSWPPAASGT